MTGRISDEQWEEIRPLVAEENHRSVRVVSVGFSVMMVIMLVASCFSPTMRKARPLYAVMMACSLVLYVVARHVRPTDEHAVGTLTYATISGLLIYSTMLGTIFNADQVATAFPAFVLVSPMLFTDRRRKIVVCIAIHTFVFVCMALAFDDRFFVADDIVNSCVFSAVSIGINSYMLKVKLEQEYAQKRLSELSEQDLLTGVRNRNSYEQALSGYETGNERSLTCIFADLNGLHELNEESGHSVGDDKLKCVASALRAAFGTENTYRIGGDEFVVFCRDLDAAQVASKVAAMRLETESMDCHVSFGTATAEAPDVDVNRLVRLAEKNMYRDKCLYYERTGHDRRGRTD